MSQAKKQLRYYFELINVKLDLFKSELPVKFNSGIGNIYFKSKTFLNPVQEISHIATA